MAADAAARPRRRRLVRALRDDPAVLGGRPAPPGGGIIGYATLACWCVLLLLLPVLHPDDVSGAGWWIAGMVALLALALYALALAWPQRREL